MEMNKSSVIVAKWVTGLYLEIAIDRNEGLFVVALVEE